jgi:hypothetical protein
MQAGRAAPAPGLALDADDVGGGVVGAVGDRVLADQPVRQVDVEMGTRLERGEVALNRLLKNS